jgi:hypothetical protein
LSFFSFFILHPLSFILLRPKLLSPQLAAMW